MYGPVASLLNENDSEDSLEVFQPSSIEILVKGEDLMCDWLLGAGKRDDKQQ